MQFATKLVSTRRGTLIAALLIALLAGASILLYLNSYRDSLKAQGANVTVLVAKQTIPKGTSGSVVAQKDLYTVTTIKESQLLEGAMSDPASLKNKVATTEIFAGAQLTATDFGAAGDSPAAADRPRADRLGAARLGPRHDRRDRARQPSRRLRLQRDPARRRRHADQRRSGAADAAADPRRRPGRRGRRQGARARRTSASRSTTSRRRSSPSPPTTASCGWRCGRARARRRRSPASSRSRPCSRRPAGADPEVGRRPSMNSRGFHVYAALEASLGLDAIREALLAAHRSARCRWRRGRAGSEIQQGADLVIVGCSQAHDQALEVISAASAQRADRPVVVLYHGSPNGFERASRPARTTSCRCRNAGQLGFALEKALARRGTTRPRPRGR